MESADVPTLPGLLERAAREYPSAGVAFEDERQSFAELLASATEYARRLTTLGVRPDDKVGIFAGDRPEYLWALYGATLLGAVAVPVNGRFKSRELRHAITNAELKVLFCGGGFADHAGLVAEALDGIEGPRHVIAWDAGAPEGFMTDFDAVAPTGFEPPALTLADPAMILYTSGTTAMPKGCVLSHAALVRPAYAMRDRFALTAEDRMWDALPLFHLASLLPLHACMLAGASYVAMRRFDPGAALAQMERERCTTAFPAFETVWLAVLNHPDYETTDLSAMRLVLNVGTRERLEQMQAKLHWATQISSYGCTELGGVCCFGHIEDPLELRVTTSGRPFPGMEIRIIDPETGQQLGPGEQGEIISRGHSMFSGYYREPEITAQVIDADGFFHTGDLGAVDEDGRVQYRGRLKDMLKVGGENVGAAEIEGHLATHDAVEIVQVVGVRDARYSEVPVAFVQLRAGASATDDELIGHCLGAIATYKVPRYVRFVNDWPMSGTKIQKFRLREQITAELDAAGIAEAPKLTTVTPRHTNGRSRMGTRTIVVGAGSAGGALAARLTEDPDQEVILVEAGPDYPNPDDLPGDVRDAYEMSVVSHDWGLQAYFVEPTSAREPQPYPRGRLVGGSSSVNAAIAQRSTVEDHDTWVAAGNDRWSYDHVLPYYRRLENDLDFGDTEEHGGSGPVPIFRHPREEWSDGARAFEQALLDRGFGRCADFNARHSTGVGSVPRNQIGTVRASSLVTYLQQARDRPNLTIRANTHCLRVLFEGRRAVGVEVERDGQVERLSADRVVLSAGAIHSPQILMLSGVGPKDVLARFGIEPVANLEGVGQNLQDHPFCPVMGLLKEDTEHVGVRAELKFSTSTGGLVDDMMLYGSVLDPATLNMPVETRGLKALTVVSLLAKPRSVGWLTLSSANPKVQPELHVNFLSNPSDIERLKEAVRLSWDLVTSSPLKEQFEELLFPTPDALTDDDSLEAYIRAVANTSYHASCTCRMGPEGDAAAVVDQELAVHRTEGLWVADASVMVNVPTGLTNLASYMIGERAADFLKGVALEPALAGAAERS